MGRKENAFIALVLLLSAGAGAVFARGNVGYSRGGSRSDGVSGGGGSRPVQQAQPVRSQPVQRSSGFSGGGSGSVRSFSQPQVQRQAVQSQPRVIQPQAQQPQVQRQVIQSQPRVIQPQAQQPQAQRQVIQAQPQVFQPQAQQPQAQRQVIQSQPRVIQQSPQQEQRQVIQSQPRTVSAPSSGRTFGNSGSAGVDRNAPIRVSPLRVQPRSGQDTPARDTGSALGPATPKVNVSPAANQPARQINPIRPAAPAQNPGTRPGSTQPQTGFKGVSAPSAGRNTAPAEASPVSGRTSPARLVTPMRRAQPAGGGIGAQDGIERARLSIPSEDGNSSGRTFGGSAPVPVSGRASVPRISPLRKAFNGGGQPGDVSRPDDRPSRGTQPVLRPSSGDDREFWRPGHGPGDGRGPGYGGRGDFGPCGPEPGKINISMGRGGWCDDPCGPDFRPPRHHRPPRCGAPVFFNPWCFTYGVWGTSYGWWDSGPVYYDSWYDSSWSCSRVYYGGWRHGWYGGATYVHNPWYVYRSAYYYTEPVYVETPVVVETVPSTVVVQQPVVVPTAPTVVQTDPAVVQTAPAAVQTAPTVVQTYPVVQGQPVQVNPTPVAQPAGTVQDGTAAQESAEVPCTCPCHCNGVRPCVCAYPCGSEYSFTDEVMDLRQSFQSYAETLDPERIWASYEGQDRETDEADVEPLLR